jgi:two-component system, NtrC family, response regulator HydG
VKTLQEQTWPGNVRQLQHLLERMVILSPRIDSEAVHDAIHASETREANPESLAETEAEQIRRVLAATGGNKSRAAQILGIERKTLYRKLERM